jgi:hypothetical protein
MNNDPDSIFDIFIPECDCDNCAEKMDEPDMFANILTVNGESSIQVFNNDFKHLEGKKYANAFDALDVIKENKLTLLAWVS